MSEPILYIDTSEIREGKLAELKAAMNEFVEFVEANEPRLLAYNVYFNEDGSRMTVVHFHADAGSLEFHLKMAGPVFPRFVRFVNLLAIDVYGNVDDDLLERMRQKARVLGTGSVLLHQRHAGFARFTIR